MSKEKGIGKREKGTKAAVLLLLLPFAFSLFPSQAAAADVQDVVFLGEDRPVFIRLHIQRDGQSFQAAWEAYIQELFKFLDRDGDGVLNKEEAARVPSAPQLLQQFRGYYFFPQGAPVRFQDLDADQDGKVTRAELAAYYRRSGAGPLQMAINPNNASSANALTEALFKALDSNRDGRLSREELARADTALRRFDVNDDEMITPEELVSSVPSPTYAVPVARLATVRGLAMQVPSDAHFVLITPDGSPRQQTTRLQLARRLLGKYDRDGDQKLSREEIGLDQVTFNLLDTNRDGQLDIAELMQLLLRPPHVELVVRLGKVDRTQPGVDLVSQNGRPAALASTVSRPTPGSATLALPDARIDLRRLVTRGAALNFQRYRQFYVTQFRAADTNKDGCLDMNEVQQSRFQYYLRPILLFADRDGDGKLTEKELNAFLDLLDKGVGCSTALTINHLGRGLFAILDGDGDGRLGVRELRTSWSRLAAYDRGNKGHVTRHDIPLQFEVIVGGTLPVSARGGFGGGAGVYGVVAPRRLTPRAGPLWFQKMDRNGDGDVSPREFLGTREDFKRIDTDGDGLIDAEEATRADAWFRSKLAKPGP
jgi:Ca2+-binding EF-hand superfamily protein